MIDILPIHAYVGNRELCIKVAGHFLSRGQLTAMLGAGASRGMGLPDWHTLVERLIAATGIDDSLDANASPEALMRIVNKVERAAGVNFLANVSESLYEDAREDRALLEQKLLAVLGAMAMGSKRGSIKEVLTFNFDDVFERYLWLHGFNSQVITDLPTLRSDVDVTVYHPHGFLPREELPGMSASNEVILSKYSFDNRLGQQLNPWQELLRDLLNRKVALFFGLSTGSPTLMTVLTAMSQSLASTRGPTGFWLLGPQDAQDVDADLIDINIVPVRMDTYDEFVDFLLAICRSARH